MGRIELGSIVVAAIVIICAVHFISKRREKMSGGLATSVRGGSPAQFNVVSGKRLDPGGAVGTYRANPGFASEGPKGFCGTRMDDCAGVSVNADDSVAVVYRGVPGEAPKFVDAAGWTSFIPVGVSRGVSLLGGRGPCDDMCERYQKCIPTGAYCGDFQDFCNACKRGFLD